MNIATHGDVYPVHAAAEEGLTQVTQTLCNSGKCAVKRQLSPLKTLCN